MNKVKLISFTLLVLALSACGGGGGGGGSDDPTTETKVFAVNLNAVNLTELDGTPITVDTASVESGDLSFTF